MNINLIYMFLNGIFMCGCDRVSNTAGTYGAFLKIWRSMALKDIILEEPEFTSKGENIIIMSDVLDCVKSNKNQEIVYIDPPYNKRQYASNFHVLENIVVNDKPLLKGKSGLRDYSLQKSNYCISKKVLEEFKLLINNIDSKYIVMSYSTEGLMEEKDIYDIFNNRGETKVYRNNYRRFKTNAWTSNSTGLEELLFICKTNE